MKHINIIGYIKDLISSVLFLVSGIVLLLIKDVNKIKKLLVILLFICFSVDFSFTIFPKFHFTKIGYNLPTFIYFTGLLIGIIFIIIYKNDFVFKE